MKVGSVMRGAALVMLMACGTTGQHDSPPGSDTEVAKVSDVRDVLPPQPNEGQPASELPGPRPASEEHQEERADGDDCPKALELDVWTRSARSKAETSCTGVVADANGYAYVVGTFQGRLQFASSDSTQLAAPRDTPQAMYLTRIDPRGKVAWGKVVRSSTEVYPVAVASDAAGSIYVAGHHIGCLYFGDGEAFATKLCGPNDHSGGFLAKYRPDTGTLVWARSVAAGREAVRISSLAVTPYGVAVVAGDYELLGREGFVERFLQEGDAPRRVVFDTPGYRGPLLVSLNKSTLAVAGGMAAEVDLPDQYGRSVLAGREGLNSFVAWYDVGDFALLGGHVVGAGDVLALAADANNVAAVVSAGHNQNSYGRAAAFELEDGLLWSEPVSLMTHKAAHLDFSSEGKLLASRTLGPAHSGRVHRVEAGIAPVRGDGDAAVTIFRDDVGHSYTLSAGGSGIVEIKGMAPAADGAIYVCGQFTETAVFWKGDERAVIYDAGNVPTAFVSRVLLP